ncbi:MAG: hypothetical protein WCJ07_02710 [Verrucomicrobiota bacterium]
MLKTGARCVTGGFKTRRELCGFRTFSAPVFGRAMKKIGFVILLVGVFQGFASGIVAPGARLEKLAGDFKFT